MIERESHEPSNLWTILGIGLTLVLINSAFSLDIRKLIGKRDSWTCQSCGKKYSQGFMVHAAHKSEYHLKSHPEYNTIQAGEIKCVECHQRQHEEGTALGKHGDEAAVRLLKATPRRFE